MFDRHIRPLKDWILVRLVRPMVGRIRPDTVTLLSLLPGLGAALFLYLGLQGAALACWIANRVLDGMDGLLARESGGGSDHGAYLDIMLDFIVYAAIPLALVFGPQGALLQVPALLMMASFYVNGASWMFLSAIIEKRGFARRHDGAGDAPREAGSGGTGGSAPTVRSAPSVEMPSGLVEGTETVVAYSLIIALPQARELLMYLLAGLCMVGALVRMFGGLRMLIRAESGPKQGGGE